MMTRMFRGKIGHIVEVYIDDMVVKIKQEMQHIEDLQGYLRCFGNISCARTQINVLLG